MAMLRDFMEKVENVIQHLTGRNVIEAALLEATGEVVRAVATDGLRLAVVSEASTVPQFKCFSSRPAASAIKRLSGATVEISETETRLLFKVGQQIVYANKVDCQSFPRNWEQIFPRAFQTEVRVEAQVLRRVLNRIGTVVDQSVRIPPVWLSVLENGLAVAEWEKKIWCRATETTVSGQPIECLLNFNYLMDFVNNTAGDVRIGLNRPKSVVTFRNGERDRYRYALMPI